MLSENRVKIKVALEAGALVKKQNSERIALPSYNDNCTDDCIKCFIKEAYYRSTAIVQKEILVNGISFDEWLEKQPLEL